jgi:hypothetical protein
LKNEPTLVGSKKPKKTLSQTSIHKKNTVKESTGQVTKSNTGNFSNAKLSVGSAASGEGINGLKVKGTVD